MFIFVFIVGIYFVIWFIFDIKREKRNRARKGLLLELFQGEIKRIKIQIKCTQKISNEIKKRLSVVEIREYFIKPTKNFQEITEYFEDRNRDYDDIKESVNYMDKLEFKNIVDSICDTGKEINTMICVIMQKSVNGSDADIQEDIKNMILLMERFEELIIEFDKIEQMIINEFLL